MNKLTIQNLNYLTKHLPIYSVVFLKNELFFYLSLKKQKNILFFFKLHSYTLFSVLSDLSVVDFLTGKRFDLIYNLLSLHYNRRIQIVFPITELDQPFSIHQIYKGSLWYEREIYDMFGIFFKDHPDLRRLLTDYGFQGHPLLKDYPLNGYVELYYNDLKKQIIYNNLHLSQKNRIFSF